MGQVFRAKAIVTSNANHDVIEDGFLAIEKDKILDVGPWKKRPRVKKFTQTDISDWGMITPGLFNLHTHTPMTLLRGVAEDLDLHSWLFKYIIPLETKWVSPEMCRVGAELAACELIRNGITFAADMYYFIGETGKVFDRMGLRALLCHHVWDQKCPDAKDPETAFKNIRALAKAYKKHPRIQVAVAPHAPYTCSLKVLKECTALAKELDLIGVTHLAETKQELTDILKEKECTPTGYIDNSGFLTLRKVLLAHSVWITDQDLPLLKKSNITCVLNPQCNAKISSGVAPISKFQKNGIRFALGTDGAASNNNMDIFAELNFFSKIHHLYEGDLTGLKGPDAFDSVTRKSAEAVGLEKEIGSLEPGKQADFIILNTKVPHLTPLTHPYSHLIYSVRGSDVDSTYVAGKCLMKNKKILVADEAKIISKAEAFWKKMKA